MQDSDWPVRLLFLRIKAHKFNVILVVTICIFLYTVFLVRDPDNAFERAGGSDDVDMCLLDQFERKAKREPKK